jgi:hypothetical protein
MLCNNYPIKPEIVLWCGEWTKVTALTKNIIIKLEKVIEEHQTDFSYSLPSNFDALLSERAKIGVEKRSEKVNFETSTTNLDST